MAYSTVVGVCGGLAGACGSMAEKGVNMVCAMTMQGKEQELHVMRAANLPLLVLAKGAMVAGSERSIVTATGAWCGIQYCNMQVYCVVICIV